MNRISLQKSPLSDVPLTFTNILPQQVMSIKQTRRIL